MNTFVRSAAAAFLATATILLANSANAGSYLYVGEYDQTSTTQASVNLPINAQTIGSAPEHSLFEMSMSNQGGATGNIIEIGVTTDVALNGDRNPHWFVSSWVNGTWRGYDAGSGFVPSVGNFWTTPLTSYEGTSGAVEFQYSGGKWLLYLNGVSSGYFPGSEWSGAFTTSSFTQVFGEVYTDGTFYPTLNGTVSGYLSSAGGYLSPSVVNSPYAQSNASATGFTVSGPPPAPSYWATAASGNWSSSARWTSGVPNGLGALAGLSVATTASMTATVDMPVTLGALQLGDSAAPTKGYTLSGSNALTFNNLGSGATVTVADGTHAINAPVILADNLTVMTGGTNSWTLSFGTASSIGGGYSLTMSGTGGTLILSGSNSYSGSTTVSGGTLQVGNGTSGEYLASPSISVSNSAALVFNHSDALTYSGIISGLGSLTQTGTGTLTLLGSNTYNGGTTISAGTLQVGNGGSGEFLGSPSISVSSSAALVFNHSDALTYSGPISGNGSLTKIGSGMLSLTGMNTYLGSTTVSAGTVQILAGQLPATSEYVGSSGTATLVLSGGSNSAAGGTLYVGNNLGDSGTYILSGSGLLSVACEYVGNAGSGSLTQSGGINTASTLFNMGYYSGSLGTYCLSGGSLNVPVLYVGSAGTGNFTQSGGTNAATGLILGVNAGGAGTYNLNGGLMIVGSGGVAQGSGGAVFNFSGGTFQAGSTFSTSLPIVLGTAGSNGTFDTNDNTLNLTGALSGPGGFQKIGAGALILAASNGYAGSTLVSNGTLLLADPNAISGSTFDTSGAGSLSFGTLTSANFGGLQGSGNLALSNTASAAVALTVGGNNANTTFSGGLGGGGSLTKLGSGRLTLSASNGYTGTTLVSGGTLLLADPNAISGSTFDTSGAGSLSFGTLTSANFGGLQGSGNLALTDASGMDVALTVGLNNANTTFAGTLSDLSGGGSLTKVGTGTLALSGTNTYMGGTTVAAGTLIVANNAGLADGSSLTVGDASLFAPVIPNLAASGMTPSTVPEPSTLALLTAAICAAAVYRRSW